MKEDFETEFNVVLVEEIRAGGNPVWTALHPELFGCNATGFSQAEALANLNKSREVWLAVAANTGMPVPSPVGEPSVTTMFSVARDANVSTNIAQEIETQVSEVPAAA